MHQHQAIERRVAQHYSHPQLETAIVAALAAEGKNIDHVTAGDLAAVDHFHTCGSEATADLRDRVQAARAFFRRETEKAEARGGPRPLGTHILLKGEAPRMLPNLVNLYERDVLAPFEFICRAR